MTITMHNESREGDLIVSISKESLAEFKHLVARGMNTWQDASIEMENFAELLQFGKIVTVRPVCFNEPCGYQDCPVHSNPE